MIAHLLNGVLYPQPSRLPHPGTRPVLVLDPDDDEGIEALRVAYMHAPNRTLADAVRSLLPKSAPPEPGMAARVTAGGMQWARSTGGVWCVLDRGVAAGMYIWAALCDRYPDLVIEGGDES